MPARYQPGGQRERVHEEARDHRRTRGAKLANQQRHGEGGETEPDRVEQERSAPTSDPEAAGDRCRRRAGPCCRRRPSRGGRRRESAQRRSGRRPGRSRRTGLPAGGRARSHRPARVPQRQPRASERAPPDDSPVRQPTTAELRRRPRSTRISSIRPTYRSHVQRHAPRFVVRAPRAHVLRLVAEQSCERAPQRTTLVPRRNEPQFSPSTSP